MPKALINKWAGGMPGMALVRQFSHAVGFQAVQMGLSAVIGFLIIHQLSKEHYAIFSLLNLGISTFLGLSSMAVVSVFIPFARKNNISTDNAFDVIAFFRNQDRRVFIIGGVFTVIFWLFSAYQNGWLDLSFLVLIALGFVSGINLYEFRLRESANKVLDQPILPLSISVVVECGRLLLLVIALTLLSAQEGMLKVVALAVIMVICSFTALKWINLKMRCRTGAPVHVPDCDPKLYSLLMRPLWFPGYFYHFSQMFKGSLVYWISGTAVIAESAALGRLMMLFALLDKAVELVLIPRLGAITTVARYLRRLALAGTGLLAIGVVLLVSAWLVPQLWLWILGAQYGNLTAALIWAVAAAVIERLSGLILFAQLARGETRNQWWVPVLSVGTYLAFAYIFGLSSAEKVATGLLLSAAVNLLAQLAILCSKLRDELVPKSLQDGR